MNNVRMQSKVVATGAVSSRRDPAQLLGTHLRSVGVVARRGRGQGPAGPCRPSAQLHHCMSMRRCVAQHHLLPTSSHCHPSTRDVQYARSCKACRNTQRRNSPVCGICLHGTDVVVVVVVEGAGESQIPRQPEQRMLLRVARASCSTSQGTHQVCNPLQSLLTRAASTGPFEAAAPPPGSLQASYQRTPMGACHSEHKAMSSVLPRGEASASGGRQTVCDARGISKRKARQCAEQHKVAQQPNEVQRFRGYCKWNASQPLTRTHIRGPQLKR